MKLEEAFYFLKALGFEALSWTQAGAEAINGHQNMTTVPVWSWSLWHILLSRQNKVTYRTKPAPIKQTYSCLQLHLQQISSTLTYFVSPIVYPTSLKTKDMEQCEVSSLFVCWICTIKKRRGLGQTGLQPHSATSRCAYTREREENGMGTGQVFLLTSDFRYPTSSGIFSLHLLQEWLDAWNILSDCKYPAGSYSFDLWLAIS